MRMLSKFHLPWLPVILFSCKLLTSNYGLVQFCCLWKICLCLLILNCTQTRVITDTKTITRILSKADGIPPLWTCPRIVTRASCWSFVLTSYKKKTTQNIGFCARTFSLTKHNSEWLSCNTINCTVYLLNVISSDRVSCNILSTLCHNDNA